jgi:hypothetical protein
MYAPGRMRSRRSSRLAARHSCLHRPGLSGEDMANAYVRALKRMLNMLRDTRRPFVARVSITGEVELLAVHKK